MTRASRIYNLYKKRIISLINSVGEIGYPHATECTGAYLAHMQKIIQNGLDFNVKPEGFPWQSSG